MAFLLREMDWKHRRDRNKGRPISTLGGRDMVSGGVGGYVWVKDMKEWEWGPKTLRIIRKHGLFA